MVVQIETTASRQLKEIQNTTNSKNRHIVFWIFMKKQENNRVSDILSLLPNQYLWNKDEITLTLLFSCFFLNIENTRCLFSEFVLFSMYRLR